MIIQVKDVRFALPSSGEDTQLIDFTDRLHIRNRMTLKEVIEAPDLARKLFSNTSLVNLSLPNLGDRKDLFLGKFPRTEFRSFNAGFAVGEGALTSCEGWTALFAKRAASLSQGDIRIGQYGWAEFKESERPPTVVYVRSPFDADVKLFFRGYRATTSRVAARRNA